jgi:uncharacterized Fe-S cluster-containing radical SAM superfamily protein
VVKYIPTHAFSERQRRKGIDVPRGKILVSNFLNSGQEKDLTVPPNCNGFGRVRHFRRRASDSWPENPLPIEPATRALGLRSTDVLRAQVFQNAVCNWRCWYCFVPFRLLDGREENGAWLSAAALLDLYLAQPEVDRPRMIDLTGGQPDLVPEWVPWVMIELRQRDLEGKVYLWSDDNLSNDYFWRYLSEAERELVATFRGYGRVACFKGFDERSFSFNTLAAPEMFACQFDLFERLASTGMDLYAYATFTTPNVTNVADAMARFVDKLQAIDENLPLRTVPLEITMFAVVRERLPTLSLPVTGDVAVENQYRAIEAWLRELDRRFPTSARTSNIVDIPFRRLRR